MDFPLYQMESDIIITLYKASFLSLISSLTQELRVSEFPFFFSGLEIERRASCMLDEHSSI
jgi:hypothetical protein